MPQLTARKVALVLVLVGIALIPAVVIIIESLPEPGPQPRATSDPAIVANLTALPNATPLQGEAAQIILDLQARVDACADYSPARRQQMGQHIRWLIDPSGIPPDLMPAFGANPPERLIFGMASYTEIEWRRNLRSPASCLIDIGHMLNAMLEAAGGERLTIYDEITSP